MRIFRNVVIFLLFVGMPATLLADVNIGNLPADTKWYFHADFEEMRSSEAGSHLYVWLQDEVFDDIREEAGVDLDKEADTLTGFSANDGGIVIVIDGRISQDTQDKFLAVGAAAGTLDKLGSGNKIYYHLKDDDEHDHDGNDNIDIDVDSFDDGAYFSFALKGKIIVTATEEDMAAMIANKGKIDVGKSPSGALIVLSAERNLMQAGIKADEIGNGVDWDSNILKNTEQAALLVADEKGKLAIEAQLVTTEKEMADSLASIVRGLISLQIFNDELDPEVASFLQNTSVEVDGSTLKLKVKLDPEVVVATLD